MSTVLEVPMTETLLRPKANRTQPDKAQQLQERIDSAYKSFFALLHQQYLITDPERVFAFLRQHSHLIPVLQEGKAVVSLIFGEETSVRLNLLHDPEIGQAHLVAWIQTALPAKDAVDRIGELDDTWFGERLEIVGDLLNFNLGAGTLEVA